MRPTRTVWAAPGAMRKIGGDTSRSRVGVRISCPSCWPHASSSLCTSTGASPLFSMTRATLLAPGARKRRTGLALKLPPQVSGETQLKSSIRQAVNQRPHRFGRRAWALILMAEDRAAAASEVECDVYDIGVIEGGWVLPTEDAAKHRNQLRGTGTGATDRSAG